ncbi:MAG: SDR family oxidoreductase [Blastocatellia bacterium]|nr:SDR family oxidoreductase [Blastocatellia bacterium]
MSKWALITGASSGIGKELAEVAASDKNNVVVTARNEEKLEELAKDISKKYGVLTKVVALDLVDPAAPQKLFDELSKQAIIPEILINNAGYGLFGGFHETDVNDELSMLQLNIVSLTHLTKLFLPNMIKRKAGKVMNVASTAAFQPGPLMAVYYATKAYVLSLSEALAEELSEFGVTVTALCPGPTESGFQARAQMEDSKLVQGKKIMSSRTVAEIGYDGMMKGKAIVIPGSANKILAQSVRFLPRRAIVKIVKKIQERAS